MASNAWVIRSRITLSAGLLLCGGGYNSAWKILPSSQRARSRFVETKKPYTDIQLARMSGRSQAKMVPEEKRTRQQNERQRAKHEVPEVLLIDCSLPFGRLETVCATAALADRKRETHTPVAFLVQL